MKYVFTKETAQAASKKRWESKANHGIGRNPYLELWYSLKTNRSALLKKVSFSITADDIKLLFDKQEGLCSISGLSMVLSRKSHFSVSVDRIDNTKGYDFDNIRLVCKAVNLMRNVLSDKELLFFCKSIVDKNK